MTPTLKNWIATVAAPAAARGPDLSPDEFEITASTGDEDRMHDRIPPDGLDVTGWLKNPSVMFAHDFAKLPVAVGTAIRRIANGWRIRARWLKGDEFAARVRNAWDQYAINTASVSVRVVKAAANDLGGTDFLKTELLEVSLVPIPANPHALRGMGRGEEQLRAIERWMAERGPALRAPSGLQPRPGEVFSPQSAHKGCTPTDGLLPLKGEISVPMHRAGPSASLDGQWDRMISRALRPALRIPDTISVDGLDDVQLRALVTQLIRSAMRADLDRIRRELLGGR